MNIICYITVLYDYLLYYYLIRLFVISLCYTSIVIFVYRRFASDVVHLVNVTDGILRMIC